jgi:uncharacterized RDD family membrane protein YckC
MSTPGPNAQNPYAPPTARVQDVADSTGPGELAERGTRLGAFLIDSLILALVYLPALWSVIRRLAAAAAAGHPITDPFEVSGMLISDNPGRPYTAVLFLIWAVITIVFVARNGQSIGKRILGIKVVRTDGRKASFWRIFLLRNVVNAIPSFIPFVSYVYWLVDTLWIFGESRQCLHDKIAITLVVKA